MLIIQKLLPFTNLCKFMNRSIRKRNILANYRHLLTLNEHLINNFKRIQIIASMTNSIEDNIPAKSINFKKDNTIL